MEDSYRHEWHLQSAHLEPKRTNLLPMYFST